MNLPGEVDIAIRNIGFVYENTIDLFIHVNRRLEDLSAGWELFFKQGMLPETTVIKKLQQDVMNDKKRLEQQGYHLMKGVRTEFSGLTEKNMPPYWSTLNDVKGQLFDMLQKYSEALTYLTQHLNSRVGTLVSSEATHGSTLTTHRFSGIQAVYDAAEALMYDYISSLSNHQRSHYKGLVAFGYDYQATAWQLGLTMFPLFAEHPRHIALLVMLAHEAAHIVQDKGIIKEWRIKVDSRLKNILENNKLFMSLLANISVDPSPRFIPHVARRRHMAGEIVSDIYATLVAGPAYLRILARYFPPMYVDISAMTQVQTQPPKEDITWSFYMSSFKLRLANQIALKCDYIGNEEVRNIDNYIERIENSLIEWIAKATPQIPTSSDMHVIFRTASRSRARNSRRILKQIQEDILRTVEELTSDQLISEMITSLHVDKFSPKNEGLSEFFSNKVSFQNVLECWQKNPDWKPRHLISLLVPQFGQKPDKNINRFAIILALSHHPNIILRYQKLKER